MSALTDQVDALQETSDANDDRLGTVEDTTSTQDDSISAIQDTVGDGSLIGQLDFPLTPDSVSRIKECFPNGTLTFVAGTATLTDSNISTTSVILYSVQTVSGYTPTIGAGGGTYASYSYVASNGSAVFTSSLNTDTSTLVYVIFS